MLARLEELPGLTRAEVDYGADFLRLTVDDTGTVAPALALVNELGYGAVPTHDDPAVARWYDRASVGELSRIEAETIAERVVTRFAASELAPPHARDTAAAALRDAIARSLHAAFVNTTLGAGPSAMGFRAQCVTDAVATITPLVGEDGAREIGRLLGDDMSQIHRDRR